MNTAKIDDTRIVSARIKQEDYDRLLKIVNKLPLKITLSSLVETIIKQGISRYENNQDNFLLEIMGINNNEK